MDSPAWYAGELDADMSAVVLCEPAIGVGGAIAATAITQMEALIARGESVWGT